MRKYDLVIFDLDGTLMKTADGVLGSAVKAMKEMGYEPPPFESMRHYIGPPIQQSFQQEFGLTEEQAQEMTACFRKYYFTEGWFVAEAFDGIFEVLEAIRAVGVKTAVGTNKREEYARKMMDHFGFAPYFDVVHGPDELGKLKKADIIALCAKDCGAELGRTLMVGDSTSDSNGARTAGVDFLGLTFGYGFMTREEVMAEGAVACAENMEELKTLLLSM